MHIINMHNLFSKRFRLPTLKDSLSPSLKKTLPLCGVICFFIICLVSNPQKYIQSVKNGMLLFFNNVAPALFPFFFFTKLLTGLGFADYLGKIGGKPLQKIYNCPKCASYVLMMSVVSGYPVGSKLLCDLHSNGVITSQNAKSISTFTSTSGPLFVIGTVGALMLNNPCYGYICFCCHLLGSLANGLFYRQRSPKKFKPQSQLQSTSACQLTPSQSTQFKQLQSTLTRQLAQSLPATLPPTLHNHDRLLGDSINSSILSVLAVGGYIAIFSMIVDALTNCGFITLLSQPIAALLRLCHQPPELARGIIISCLEITRGCYELSSCGVNIITVLPYITAMLSFGGLSIIAQSTTFLNACNVKTSFFILSKLSQAIITFVITFLFCLLL